MTNTPKLKPVLAFCWLIYYHTRHGGTVVGTLEDKGRGVRSFSWPFWQDYQRRRRSVETSRHCPTAAVQKRKLNFLTCLPLFSSLPSPPLQRFPSLFLPGRQSRQTALINGGVKPHADGVRRGNWCDQLSSGRFSLIRGLKYWVRLGGKLRSSM